MADEQRGRAGADLSGTGDRTAPPAGRAPWSPSPLQLDRDRYRRRAGVRSALVAAVSTVVLGAVLVLGLTSTPGWPRIQASFLVPSSAWAAVPDVARGLWLNLRIMVVCAVVVFVLGVAVAVLRTLRGPVFAPVRWLATAYTDLFRGLPLILVLLLVGYGVPGLRLQGLPGDPVVYGCVALVLTYTAYVAEVLRAGIESVHPSQRAAARALGLGHAATLRHVVLPQAVRRVLPALLNDLVSLQKDSGLVSVLGVVDAIRAAQILTAKEGNFTPYLVAGAFFVLLTIPMARVTDAVARRWGTPGTGGAV